MPSPEPWPLELPQLPKECVLVDRDRGRQNSSTSTSTSTEVGADYDKKANEVVYTTEVSDDGRPGDKGSRRARLLKYLASLPRESGTEPTKPVPPADGGKDAWCFLAACFIMEALVWGFPFAFGVFQDYYRTHEPFKGSPDIAIIGTCAMGVMYLGSPFSVAYQRLCPRLGRFSPFFGLVIMCLSLALSSFSTNTTHLILTQGALYGFGGTMGYNPCMLYLDEWFDRRKGMAYGMMWSGTGLGGVTIPLILEFLLDRYGFRTTLRIWAVALFVLTMPLVYFVKPRLPPSATRHIKPLDFGFVKTRVFALYQLGNVCQGLGFFLPSIFLPEYARSLGASNFGAALTLLVLNVGSTVGCASMGTLIDKLHVTTCIMICTVGTTIAVFFVWGLGGGSLPALYVFCVLYGLFAVSYGATWSGIMKAIAGAGNERRRQSRAKPQNVGGELGVVDNDEKAGDLQNQYDPLMVCALLSIGRGVGNIASGPLSEALVSGKLWEGRVLGGFGSGYGVLIVFTGVTALLGGVSCIFRRFRWL